MPICNGCWSVRKARRIAALQACFAIFLATTTLLGSLVTLHHAEKQLIALLRSFAEKRKRKRQERKGEM
jgi:hypothetical protein